MNKKTAITTAVLGILLIGIVSAGLLDYFGKITGSVEVEGPTFYLDGAHPLEGFSSIWGLELNNNSVTPSSSSFTGSNNKLFVSEKLGIEYFYAANYEIKIKAESDNESGQIDAELYYIEGNDPYNKKSEVFCSGSVGSVYDKEVYTINCQAEELTGIDPEWRLVLELSDGINEIHYKIYMDGDSYIKVTAT